MAGDPLGQPVFTSFFKANVERLLDQFENTFRLRTHIDFECRH